MVKTSSQIVKASEGVRDGEVQISFGFGRHTTPKQAYHEFLSTILEFAKVNVIMARKVGEDEITWSQVMDRIIKDLEAAKKNMEERFRNDPSTHNIWLELNDEEEL